MSAKEFTNVGACEVAFVVLRSWLAKMRISARYLTAVLVGIVVFSVVTSVILVLLLAKYFPFRISVFLVISLVNVHMSTMFTAIIFSSAAAQESSAMAWWRVTPLTRRCLGCGFSIPVWAAAIVQAIIITPIIVVLFSDSSFDYASVVTLLTCVAIATGTVMGRAVLVACKLLLHYFSPQLVSRVQPVAVIVWISFFCLSLYATQQSLVVLAEEQVLSFWAVLGYPLLMFIVVNGNIMNWGALIFWAALLYGIERWLWAHIGLERYDSSKVSTLGFSCRFKSSLPVFKLEMVRLVRSSRVQAFIVSNIITQIFLIAAQLKFNFGVETGIFINVVLLNAVFSAYCLVIVRGLSDRLTPYPMVMGLAPQRWAIMVNLAAIMLSLSVVFPFLLVWSLAFPEMPSLFIGISVVTFTMAVASIIGFTMMPAADTGMVEVVSLFMSFVVTAMAIKFAQGIGWEEPEEFSILLLVLGFLLFVVPSLIEKIRWDGIDAKINLVNFVKIKRISRSVSKSNG